MRINLRHFKVIKKGTNRGLIGVQHNISNPNQLMNLREAALWATRIQDIYLSRGKTGRINVSLNTTEGRTSQAMIRLGRNVPYVIDRDFFYDPENGTDITYPVFLDNQYRGIREVSIFVVIDD